MKCQTCQEQFSELFYDEISEDARKRLEKHLADCADCKKSYEEFAAVLGVMAKRERPEPSAEFLDSLWANVAPELQKPSAPQNSIAGKIKQAFAGLLAPVPKFAFHISGAIALFVIGIAVGKIYFTSPETSSQEIASHRSSENLAQQTALDERSQAYFEKSKILLLGMVNFDADEDDPYLLNLPFNKRLSTDLVREAAVLKDDLAFSGRNRLSQLVEDLEIILLQIANLEEDVDLPAIELIQNTAQNTGVLLKINVEQMRRDAASQSRIKNSSPTSPTGKEL